jgi:hypothetical protein
VTGMPVQRSHWRVRMAQPADDVVFERLQQATAVRQAGSLTEIGVEDAHLGDLVDRQAVASGCPTDSLGRGGVIDAEGL